MMQRDSKFGEEKPCHLGNVFWSLRNYIMLRFLGCLIYSKLGNEEVSSVETLIGLETDKKRQAALSSQKTGKWGNEQCNRMENFLTTAILLR